MLVETQLFKVDEVKGLKCVAVENLRNRMISIVKQNFMRTVVKLFAYLLN